VHNRREITLNCLEHLKKTQKWDEFNVIVVDDGSTDRTGEAVRADYPSVTVLEGDGSLWWGGAMRRGMEYAREHGAEVFIWLNDDVLPEPSGVIKLADKVADLGDTVLTTMIYTETDYDYTTRNRKTRWGIEQIPYNTDVEIQSCDAAAGKFTAFPQHIVDAIGLPDDEAFPHHHCDYDYTLRAKESGFDVGVYSEVTAYDTAYETATPRLSPKISFENVVKSTIDSDRHATYSLRTVYHQHIRFYGPPQVLAYSIFICRIIRSFGAILLKLILTFIKDGQDLRSREYK
jgi:GT2 family glycosyltransferase